MNIRIKWNMLAGYAMIALAIVSFFYGHILLGVAMLLTATHALYAHFRSGCYDRLSINAEDAQLQKDETWMMGVLRKLNRGEVRRINRELCLFDSAIRNNWISVGKLLLGKCRLPTCRTIGGNTALHIVVAFSKDAKQFHEVRRQTVNINARNADGQTPMDVASMFDRRVFMNALERHEGKNAVELEQV